MAHVSNSYVNIRVQSVHPLPLSTFSMSTVMYMEAKLTLNEEKCVLYKGVFID